MSILGNIEPPIADNPYFSETDGNGIFMLLSNVFKLAGAAAGIFFVIQIILAGYGYLSASGDPKKAEAAFAKIWQSLIGLLIVSAAFVLTSFIGKLLGLNDILNPTIVGPLSTGGGNGDPLLE